MSLQRGTGEEHVVHQFCFAIAEHCRFFIITAFIALRFSEHTKNYVMRIKCMYIIIIFPLDRYHYSMCILCNTVRRHTTHVHSD